VRANRRLRLIHTRATRLPRLLADPGGLDRIEIVEIETSETVLIRDVGLLDAPRLVRAMKSDLAGLELEDFLAKWSAALDD